VVAIEISERKL